MLSRFDYILFEVTLVLHAIIILFIKKYFVINIFSKEITTKKMRCCWAPNCKKTDEKTEVSFHLYLYDLYKTSFIATSM